MNAVEVEHRDPGSVTETDQKPAKIPPTPKPLHFFQTFGDSWFLILKQ
jgi:hypothetical protein